MTGVIAYLCSAIFAFIAVAAWNDNYYRACKRRGVAPKEVLHLSGREIFVIALLWYPLIPTVVRAWVDQIDSELKEPVRQ